jgi:hypothetical protein
MVPVFIGLHDLGQDAIPTGIRCHLELTRGQVVVSIQEVPASTDLEKKDDVCSILKELGQVLVCLAYCGP